MNAMSPAIAHNAHSGVSPITTIASRIHGNVRYEPAHRRGRSTSDFDFGAELPAATRSATASNVLQGGSHELNRLAFDHPPLVRGSVKPGGVGRDCPCSASAPGMTIPATGDRRAAFQPEGPAPTFGPVPGRALSRKPGRESGVSGYPPG